MLGLKSIWRASIGLRDLRRTSSACRGNALCSIKLFRQGLCELPNQRLHGDGGVAARDDQDPYLAFRHVLPAQGQIQREMREQLLVCANEGYRRGQWLRFVFPHGAEMGIHLDIVHFTVSPNERLRFGKIAECRFPPACHHSPDAPGPTGRRRLDQFVAQANRNPGNQAGQGRESIEGRQTPAGLSLVQYREEADLVSLPRKLHGDLVGDDRPKRIASQIERPTG
jgi:hypothetical protein